jgi:hypothetical protein
MAKESNEDAARRERDVDRQRIAEEQRKAAERAEKDRPRPKDER